MRELSVQDVLRSRDCLAYACTNDAGDDGLCDEHRGLKRREQGFRSVLAGQVLELRKRGYRRAEIASALGISMSYVGMLISDPSREIEAERKNGYRRPCPNCGRLMDGGSGPNNGPELCADCTAQRQRDAAFWTRERIIKAIRDFAEVVGRPPLSSEWLYRHEWELLPQPVDLPHWPRASMVLHVFGSWAEAIEAAGFPHPQIGRKVRPPIAEGRRDRRVPVAKEYVVFEQTSDGLREIGRHVVRTPELAAQRSLESANGGDLYVVTMRTLAGPFRVEMKPQAVRVRE